MKKFITGIALSAAMLAAASTQAAAAPATAPIDGKQLQGLFDKINCNGSLNEVAQQVLDKLCQEGSGILGGLHWEICLPGGGQGGVIIPPNWNPPGGGDQGGVETPEQPEKPETPEKPENPDTPESPGVSEYAQQVVDLVNAERAKEGLSPVSIDAKVQQAADVRAKEIVSSFSHTRPNGAGFSTALSEAGAAFRASGENIAYGQPTPQQVMEGWMNSSGHRANIMNGTYSKIGVGVYKSGNTYYWTQLFTN